jgi:hypothetical protein
MRTLERRIKQVELGARAIRFPQECLCFPETEQPVVSFPIELEIAAQVECPLHGARFKPQFFIYRSKWHREKLESFRRTHHSDQYLKAWRAGFPDQLWPAREEPTPDGLFLMLRDGSRLLATGSLSETNAKGVPH